METQQTLFEEEANTLPPITLKVTGKVYWNEELKHWSVYAEAKGSPGGSWGGIGTWADTREKAVEEVYKFARKEAEWVTSYQDENGIVHRTGQEVKTKIVFKEHVETEDGNTNGNEGQKVSGEVQAGNGSEVVEGSHQVDG